MPVSSHGPPRRKPVAISNSESPAAGSETLAFSAARSGRRGRGCSGARRSVSRGGWRRAWPGVAGEAEAAVPGGAGTERRGGAAREHGEGNARRYRTAGVAWGGVGRFFVLGGAGGR